MPGRFDEAIKELLGEIDTKGREMAELKRTVNFLRAKDGLPPAFQEVENVAGTGGLVIGPDQFYGKSPITAAREYLEMKGKAALPEEISDALERGSFDFKAQGWDSKGNRTRNIAISMGKNTAIFHRLPNGYYGLAKWYPEAKKAKRVNTGEEKNGGGAGPTEDTLDEPAESAENEAAEGAGKRE